MGFQGTQFNPYQALRTQAFCRGWEHRPWKRFSCSDLALLPLGVSSGSLMSAPRGQICDGATVLGSTLWRPRLLSGSCGDDLRPASRRASGA